jgi:hypothetical protein
MSAARVLAAYATVKVLDAASGKPTYYGFYQGAILPPSADPEAVANLVRRGYAEWVDGKSDEPEPKAAEQPEPAKPAKATKAAG